MPSSKATPSDKAGGVTAETEANDGSRSIFWIPVIFAFATFSLYNLSVNFPKHPSATNRYGCAIVQLFFFFFFLSFYLFFLSDSCFFI